MSCAPSNVILTAVKLSEDGTDLILRGYETAGQETVADIRLGLDDARWTVTWKPYEIKTLALRSGSLVPVEYSYGLPSTPCPDPDGSEGFSGGLPKVPLCCRSWRNIVHPVPLTVPAARA